jgi:type VI secretion system protein ImpK
MNAVALPPHPWAAAVHRSARPLIALATQLRSAVPARPAATEATLTAAVEAFERELAAAGCDARTVTAASYLLCVWLDEVIAPHAWATATWPTHGLLQRFHGETDGRTRVFQLLDRLVRQPDADRPLLELFHVCLSLGLQGRWQDTADGARQLAALRARLAQLLHLNPAPMTVPLAARWQPAVAERRPGHARRLAIAGLMGLALAGLGVYSGSQWLLARQADQVFGSLQGLERASRSEARPAALAAAAAAAVAASAPTAPTTSPAPPGRMASALAADLQAGRIDVRDGAHRSTIVVPADGLFETDTTQLAKAQAPLLERVAKALAGVGGRVLVTAHARPDAPRSARVPSAAQLADEWARHVAQVLERYLPAGSVASEGLVIGPDQPADAAAAAARSRIEITLFP